MIDKDKKERSRFNYKASPMEYIGFRLRREYDLSENGNYPCTPKQMHNLILMEKCNGRD